MGRVWVLYTLHSRRIRDEGGAEKDREGLGIEEMESFALFTPTVPRVCIGKGLLGLCLELNRAGKKVEKGQAASVLVICLFLCCLKEIDGKIMEVFS